MCGAASLTYPHFYTCVRMSVGTGLAWRAPALAPLIMSLGSDVRPIPRLSSTYNGQAYVCAVWVKAEGEGEEG